MNVIISSKLIQNNFLLPINDFLKYKTVCNKNIRRKKSGYVENKIPPNVTDWKC